MKSNLWHQTTLAFLRNSLNSGRMGGGRSLLSLSQVPNAALSTAGPSSTSPVESGKTFPVGTHMVPSNFWELTVLRWGEASLLPQGRESSAVFLRQSRMQKVPKGKPYRTFSKSPSFAAGSEPLGLLSDLLVETVVIQVNNVCYFQLRQWRAYIFGIQIKEGKAVFLYISTPLVPNIWQLPIF